ncbi:MAG: AraC family transcriptional regulator [Lachnospiraceae bacterium]
MKLSMELREDIKRMDTGNGIHLYFPHFGTIYQTLIPHWHDELEIWYCQCDGVCKLNDDTVKFSKGTIIIVNKKVVHSRELLSDGHISVILFDYKVLLFMLADKCQNEILLPLYTEEKYLSPVINTDHVLYKELACCITNILNCWSKESFRNRLEVKAHLLLFISTLFENDEFHRYTAEEIVRKSKVTEIQESIEYMEKHLSENIAIEDLAATTNLSKYYYIRRFKALTGRTPFEYLKSVRIEYAKEILLENKNMNIVDVAMESGFNNIGYFTKVFKQQVGITPGSYRTTNEQ